MNEVQNPEVQPHSIRWVDLCGIGFVWFLAFDAEGDSKNTTNRYSLVKFFSTRRGAEAHSRLHRAMTDRYLNRPDRSIASLYLSVTPIGPDPDTVTLLLRQENEHFVFGYVVFLISASS
ncbi:MAG: hypothetical protein ACI8VE_001699 [Natrialbaceae archaeon]